MSGDHPTRSRGAASSVLPVPGSQWVMRACAPWHLGHISRLHRRCFRIAYDWTVLVYHWLSYPGGYQLIWQGSQPVAFCVGRPMTTRDAGRAGEIVAIGVAPEARRHGLASRLLADQLARFQRLGLREVHLQVRMSNVAAQGLYERLGFQSRRRLAAYYSDGEDGLLMVLRLPATTS